MAQGLPCLGLINTRIIINAIHRIEYETKLFHKFGEADVTQKREKSTDYVLKLRATFPHCSR